MRNNKKNKTIILIIFSIILVILFSTIAYSAFSSTMNITGTAHARIEANVRITDFKLESTTNATSSYEDFGKNHISTSIDFKENASAIYKVEITNYGSTNVAISNITGLTSNISYELIDYNLKDKLCSESGKCNSFATKTFYIKFTGNNITTDLTLNFEFKIFHNFTYINFNNTYTSGVIDNGSITIDLSKDSPKLVQVSSNKYINYSYENKMLTLNNVTTDLTITAINNTEYTYNFIKDYQTFTAPYDGIYKVELWGASGYYYEGVMEGAGGYTSGKIALKKDNKLYVYVGGSGVQLNPEGRPSGGYNGGGNASNSGNVEGYYRAGGGGATDIRLASGNWNDFESLKSRIMVAGGGGTPSQVNAGSAGGLIGYDGETAGFYENQITPSGTGGTQISGGVGRYSSSYLGSGENGGFGYGGSGYDFASGGGGGYYGGAGGARDTTDGSGGGGSSFISGHNGCDAIAETSTQNNITHTGQSIHYSGYYFKDTVMIDGNGYNWTTTKGTEIVGMPSYDGTSKITANIGNGYAKITLLQPEYEHTIKYINISGNYQSTINDKDNLVVNFGNNKPKNIIVLIGENQTSNYTYSNGILTINNVTNNITIINSTYIYDYTGTPQTFTTPYSGIYKVELWGASGFPSQEPGLGGYTSGEIYLSKSKKLYLYVGGAGEKLVSSFGGGGYNGGGAADVSGNIGYYDRFGGGGATDLRLTSGNWNDFNSLKSRIMVAGGGGSHSYGGDAGGTAGGLIGYSYNDISGYSGSGGTQNLGGTTIYSNLFEGQAKNGGFGYGGDGYSYASGGGSGYYGGGGGTRDYHDGSGGGGSSFISGHNGCDAITESSTENNIIHTAQPIHYSNYKFTNTIMIDGKGYSWTTQKENYIGMPNHDQTATMTGNTGHGYAKITLIEVQ